MDGNRQRKISPHPTQKREFASTLEVFLEGFRERVGETAIYPKNIYKDACHLANDGHLKHYRYSTSNSKTAVLFPPFTIFTSVCKLFDEWSIARNDLRYIQLKNGRFIPMTHHFYISL